MLAIDFKQADLFLRTVLPNEKEYVFQTFSDNDTAKQQNLFQDSAGKQRDGLARVLIGTLEQHASALSSLQAKGAGIFVQVNPGSKRGKAHIHDIRLLFVDTDGAPMEPIIKQMPKPAVLVASSPGNYHVYWKLREVTDAQTFSATQKSLAAQFNTDASMSNPDRVLRLPGSWHLKHPESPFQVKAAINSDAPDVAIKYQATSSTADDMITGSAESFELPESLPPGSRTQSLIQYIGSLAARGLDATEIEQLVRKANVQLCPEGAQPIDDDTLASEILPAIDRFVQTPAPTASTAPLSSPLAAPQTPASIDPSAISGGTQSSEFFPLTDSGHARRFLAKHGAVVRYLSDRDQWMVWRTVDNVTGWHVEKRDEAVVRMLWAMVPSIKEAVKLNMQTSGAEPEAISRAVRKLDKLQDASGTKNLLWAIARGEGVSVSDSDLDADPWVLGVANGYLDLHTGELHAPDPKHLVVTRSSVVFDASATCPRWIQFIDEITLGDAEYAAYLQRWMGYTLTGITTEHALPVLHGGGANGKSTYLNVINEILGDLASSINSNVLMGSGLGNTDDYTFAQMKGKRAVFLQEVGDGATLKEQIVKLACGGDSLHARHPGGRPFEYTPTFKLFIATNHRPMIKSNDRGMWRRVKYLRFQYSVPDAKIDRMLMDRLRDELSGILNWAVAGCLQWQALGALTEPASVVQDTLEYKMESDILEEFLDECCTADAEKVLRCTAVHQCFNAWRDQRSERPFTRTAFQRLIKEQGSGKGVSVHRDKKGTFIQGVRLNGVRSA